MSKVVQTALVLLALIAVPSVKADEVSSTSVTTEESVPSSTSSSSTTTTRTSAPTVQETTRTYVAPPTSEVTRVEKYSRDVPKVKQKTVTQTKVDD